MSSYQPSRRYIPFSPWPIALALAAMAMAGSVFAVTQAVHQRELRIDRMNRTLLTEQQTLRVLDAEWAYLTRPQRLESLMAMKVEKGDMPPTPAPIAPVAAATPVATPAIEPAAGAAVKVVEAAQTTKTALKIDKEDMANIASVEKPKAIVKAAMAKEAKPAAKTVARIEEKTAPKTAAVKKTAPVVTASNDVWPIARKVPAASQKIAYDQPLRAAMPGSHAAANLQTRRAGVARPIVE